MAAKKQNEPNRVKSPEEEQFLEWLKHPETIRFRKYLLKTRNNMKENWASGRYMAPSAEESAIRSATAIGYCNALVEVLEMDYQNIEEVLSNE